MTWPIARATISPSLGWALPLGGAAKKESKHRVRALEKLIAWLERGMEG